MKLIKYKKINYLLIIVLCLFGFSACVTTAKFEARMDAKKGLNKDQLIEEMGIPDKEYNAENFTILEYNQSYSGSNTQNSTSVVNGVLVNTATSSPYTIWCKLEFKLVNGIVESYKYRGDLCKSR